MYMSTMVAMIVLMAVVTVWAMPYTETYETTPGGTGYAAILSSPNNLSYDAYHGRAHTRLAHPQVIVVGPGDEKFYWGNNDILPPPLYHEPGDSYCEDNSTNYLFNGYGTGYFAGDQLPDFPHGNPLVGDFVLGIDFNNGPTNVYGADFGYASGSNAPTHSVTVHGYLGGVWQWATPQTTVDFGDLTHLAIQGGFCAVDRIEIERTHNHTEPFDWIPVGWYTMDNLEYEIDGPPIGDYEWEYYTKKEYLGSLGSPVPVPATMVLFGSGLAGIAVFRKNFRR